MKKKIVVLGSRGMLGQMVVKYFSPNYDVVKIDARYSLEERYVFLNLIKDQGECYVINCIGKIKQKTENGTELAFINALLPLDIYNGLSSNQILIHPTTDCVFKGDSENFYSESETPDAIDDYGWSKRLGEQALIGKKKAYILRVSIIGPDNINAKPSGLLGWFLSNITGSSLNGYVNHFWNGITTLQWCKYVEELIFNDNERRMTGKIIQFGTTEGYTKYEMLQLFQKTYKTDFTINKFEDKDKVNRCLFSTINCPALEQQLIELKDFAF